MTKAELAAKMQDAGAWLPGKTVKLDFGDDGTILLDGVGNKVSEDGGAADTTIKVSWDDWQAMTKGELDGMTAFMTGKLKVEGDMSNAMQLQGVLSNWGGFFPPPPPGGWAPRGGGVFWLADARTHPNPSLEREGSRLLLWREQIGVAHDAPLTVAFLAQQGQRVA
jgi:putative sterol carrier protein